MGLIDQFMNWVLHKPCATEGCPQEISRWICEDLVVIVGDEERLYEQNETLCSICRQQQIHEMSLEEAIQLTVDLKTGRA